MTNRKVTKWLSIKLLLVISLFFAATATEAQNKIQVTSFNRMETDVTARITAPQRDQNGEVCALIRIVTTEKDLMFEPDALGIVSRENKPGEIWLYIPRGARRISIMHDKFGVLRNYFYPDIIEKATVYEMEIQIGDGTQQTPANTNTQLIVMRPDPATADIYIDDEKVPTENGLFTATMKKGTHTYRVESPMYAPEAGIIDLGSEQKIMSVTLKPRFGYLEIFSLPEQDAKVYINNELAGQTPYKSDRMPLQEYRIRIEKDFFFPMDSTVTIFAGKTSSLTFKMKSTIKPKEPRRTLVMAEVGYHPSQISLAPWSALSVRTEHIYASAATSVRHPPNWNAMIQEHWPMARVHLIIKKVSLPKHACLSRQAIYVKSSNRYMPTLAQDTATGFWHGKR